MKTILLLAFFAGMGAMISVIEDDKNWAMLLLIVNILLVLSAAFIQHERDDKTNY